MPMTTGEILTYTTPSTIALDLTPGQYKLQCWGAQGGYRTSSSYGGLGGYAEGVLTLTKRTTIYITVGGAGGSGNTNSNNVIQGGYNGGGYRYGYPGGGGASDVRIKRDSYYSRVIVAGGGGSDGRTSSKGGYGGGASGQVGQGSYGTHGEGGTQTGFTASVTAATEQHTENSTNSYPGGFGFGGFGVNTSSGFGGAGGGGWYGGCGTVPNGSSDNDKGGGGGSGFVYTASSAANVPNGWLLDSPHYLTNTVLTAGNGSMPKVNGSGNETGHAGNGAVKITAIQASADTGEEEVIEKDLGEVILRLPSSVYSYYGLKTYLNNMIYRGADLLSLSRFEDVDTLQKNVSAGNLRDIYVGDYITVNNIKYIVMGINTYKDTGIVEGNKYHLVLVPEHCIGQEQMNEADNTNTGYAGSKMYTTLQNETYLGSLMAGFNNHILNGTWTLTIDNERNVGKFTTKIRLLNEMAVFGTTTNGIYADVGEMNSQLPGFALKNSLKVKQWNSAVTAWWLSDIDSISLSPPGFKQVYSDGSISSWYSSQLGGVVPVILFG